MRAVLRVPGRPQSSLTLRDGTAWLLLLGYAVAAGVVILPVLRHPASQFPGKFGDPDVFTWWIAWAQSWWTHGGSLLHTDALNAPLGTSTLWNTSVLGPGLLVAPVTSLAGPVASYNFLILAGMSLSAWATSLAAARWVSRPAAVVSGLLGGFGAYTVAQAYGHLNLVWLVYPALLVLLGTDLLRGAHPVRIGLCVAVATCWQFFVSTEMLTSSWVFAGVLAISLVVVRRPTQRMLRAVFIAGSTAVVSATAVLGYPLVQALGSADRHPGSIRSPVAFSGDLANLIIPTAVERFAPWSSVAAHFPGNLMENGLYLGVPLLLVLAITCWATRRRAVTRILAAAGLVMLVLSLGPSPWVAGHRYHMPLPWALLQHAFPLSSVQPDRLSAYVYLCAALLAGIGVDAARARIRNRAPTFLALALGVACAITLFPGTIPSSAVSTPAFFTSSDVDMLPAGSLVRTIPFEEAGFRAISARPMVWQAESGLRYRTRHGRLIGRHAPLDAFDWLANSLVRGPSRAPIPVRPACAALRGSSTSAVVVLAGQTYTPRVLQAMRAVTGIPGRAIDGVVLFLLSGTSCGA
jgi:hypothetical protein